MEDTRDLVSKVGTFFFFFRAVSLRLQRICSGQRSFVVICLWQLASGSQPAFIIRKHPRKAKAGNEMNTFLARPPACTCRFAARAQKVVRFCELKKLEKQVSASLTCYRQLASEATSCKAAPFFCTANFKVLFPILCTLHLAECVNRGRILVFSLLFLAKRLKLAQCARMPPVMFRAGSRQAMIKINNFQQCFVSCQLHKNGLLGSCERLRQLVLINLGVREHSLQPGTRTNINTMRQTLHEFETAPQM